MKKILNSYLNSEIQLVDLEMHYHIGNEFSGETDFRLRGDGTYQLWSTVTQGRQRRDYSGQIDLAFVQHLVRTMLSVRLWEVKHIFTERGLDNPEAHIILTCDGESFPVVLWVTEIEDVPAFDEVQEAILALVRRVSDGEVLEVGR